MWAKMSNSATSMACAACIAVAATLPWTGTAAERLVNENARLAAFTDVDAFSAHPSYGLLGGDLTAGLGFVECIPPCSAAAHLLADDTNSGYDALSALDVFFGDGANGDGGVFTGGGIDALANYDALSAIPAYLALAGGDITALNDLDALSAINPYLALAGGDITALNDLDSVSAITPYIALAGGDITATGDLDSVSAVDTFFGDGPVGADGEIRSGCVHRRRHRRAGAERGRRWWLCGLERTTGVLRDAMSRTLPSVRVCSPVAVSHALSNYDALSAIPAYLSSPGRRWPRRHSRRRTSRRHRRGSSAVRTASTTPTGSNPVQKFVASLPKAFTPPAPQVFTPPAPPKEEPKVEAAATPGDNGGPKLNVSRLSEKFTPKGFGDNPILFGSGTPGVDNGMGFYKKALNSIGLGGGGDEGGEGAGTP